SRMTGWGLFERRNQASAGASYLPTKKGTMATSKEFKELTQHLGLNDDCPLCGYSWPGCQGACVAHETMTGQMGPFHTDYNDDCNECQDGYQGYWDADNLLKVPISRQTVEAVLCGCGRSADYDEGVRERLAECDKDPSLSHVATPKEKPTDA